MTRQSFGITCHLTGVIRKVFNHVYNYADTGCSEYLHFISVKQCRGIDLHKTAPYICIQLQEDELKFRPGEMVRCGKFHIPVTLVWFATQGF